MILMVLLSVALGGVLVWALYAEPAPPRPRPVAQPLGTWSTGADLRRHGFPIVLAGYDPEAVDAHLARIATVHDALRQQTVGASRGDPDVTDAVPAGDPSDPRGPATAALPPPVPGDPPPPPPGGPARPAAGDAVPPGESPPGPSAEA